MSDSVTRYDLSQTDMLHRWYNSKLIFPVRCRLCCIRERINPSDLPVI